MKVVYTVSELYDSILPRKKNNNNEVVDQAMNLKTHLENIEKELINNFLNNQVRYSKTYLIENKIELSQKDKELLKKKMYGEWFYKSPFYNKTKLLSSNCCYCYIGSVDELDHFFNKNDNPELSITNVNLIPSCTNCNKIKPQSAIYIQPYYEDISLYQWLECELDWKNNVKKPIPVFSIIQPENMSQEMYKRLEKQLPQSKIISSLTKKATDYISSEWSNWKGTFKYVPDPKIKLLLEKSHEEKKNVYGLNSWQYQIAFNLDKDADKFLNMLNGN